MTGGHLRLRLVLAGSELEVEGDPKAVREWWDELSPQLTGGGPGFARPAVVDRNQPRMALPSGDVAGTNLPDTFGEYFHRFSPGISDVDRMLAAALYAQAASGSRSFTTRAANELLVEQGVKLSNPSMAVRRLTATKKAFAVTPGVFRVSDGGLRHLATMHKPDDQI